jgi:hypothetical protein
MFWAKVFPTENEIVVAVCDEELIGKEVMMNGVPVKISKHFYGEKLVDEEITLKMMKKATMGNLMGKKIVELAEKNGFIDKQNIILINEIPHAQFVKI